MPFPQLSRPTHVLVVDDDPTNRVVATKLCGLFGGTAEATDCGQQAVTLCATGAFDLILMDIRMPQMSGLEAAIAIRALAGPQGKTPIVAVTGDVDPKTEALCAEAGINAFVEKPISTQKLFSAMEVALASIDESLMQVRNILAFG